MPRKHIIASGWVQGVGFRYHTNHLAYAHQVTGWVRNLDSGDVELEVQGPQKSIDDFLTQLEKGSMFIRIDHLEIEDCEELQESGFVVRY
ncbi:MAG TPA: acylphosphatase [Mobilitalea sp.]|nr:acylphosphatase [Mobilitalea sp.]